MNRQIDPVTRTLLRLAGAGAALALAGCTYRDLSRQPEAGRDYRTVTPAVGKVPAGKVEVVEFFWYGCPFCRKFEPRLKAWYAQQARDLSLRIVHPAPNDGWQPAAKLYFSLQELGLAERLNQDIYGAIVDGQRGRFEPLISPCRELAAKRLPFASGGLRRQLLFQHCDLILSNGQLRLHTLAFRHGRLRVRLH